MGFFFNSTKGQTKKQPKQGSRGVIPIATLQKMGCSVCSLDKRADQIKSPKLKPSGTDRPSIYLLGGAPTSEDDAANLHWSDAMGREVTRLFRDSFMDRHVRSNYTVQCLGEFGTPETECCRGRIVADIEATEPLIIVTVGDTALQWILGSGSALKSRGTLIATRVGRHECYVFPIITPNYVHKKNGDRSEHAMILRGDIEEVKRLIDDGLPPLEVYHEGQTEGVEVITGHEPGDIRRLEQALEELRLVDDLALDLETDRLRVRRQTDAERKTGTHEPLILTAAVGNFERVVAFPLSHPKGWQTDAHRRRAWELFGEFILNSARKAAHNLSFELEWLEFFYGERPLRMTEWDDTLLMAHTLDERPGTKSLDYQCRVHFGFWLKALSARVDSKNILGSSYEDVLLYNGLDAKWTSRLKRRLRPMLAQEPVFVEEAEHKTLLAPVLVMTEAKGLPLDKNVAEAILVDLEGKLTEIESKVMRCPEVIRYEQKFGRFSPTNSDHVLVMMDKILQRPEIKVTDWNGKESKTTGEEALSAMPAREVPSAPLILEHRGVAKLISTYVRPAAEGRLVDFDGMIRTKYSSATAVTGRLVSDDTNVQNWPKRKFAYIRAMIRAIRSGKAGLLDLARAFLACDYGQIEFRVVGMASEDPAIVEACWTGYDVHKFWAERVLAIYPEIKDWIVAEFGVDWAEKGLKTLRQEMKNKWVFPQLFGSSIRSCADQLRLPDWVAEDLGAEFWGTFRRTKKWQEKLVEGYQRKHYVETLSGRRRRGAMTKNELINMPIQGSAADIVKAAMIGLSEQAEILNQPDLQPVLNVHDDLTFMPLEDQIDELLPIIAREMCMHRFDWINVPLVVEASVGLDWHKLEEVKVYRSHELFNLRNPYA